MHLFSLGTLCLVLLHVHSLSLAFQKATVKSYESLNPGLGKLSGIQQAIKKADGRNKIQIRDHPVFKGREIKYAC